MSNPSTENATQHTPGPWFIFGNGHCVGGPCGPDEINDARGASAGVAMCGMSRRGEDESRANAHLICAAPDLLESLQELLAAQANYDVVCVTSVGETLETARERLQEANLDARAAIAKANGLVA